MSIGTIKKDKQLNDRHLRMTNIAHQMSEQLFPQVWNEYAKHINKFTPTTGDEVISIYSTFLADFCARSIIYLKHEIVDNDVTGYSLNEIQEMVFDCISEMISTKKFRCKQEPSNSEFKRLSLITME